MLRCVRKVFCEDLDLLVSAYWSDDGIFQLGPGRFGTVLQVDDSALPISVSSNNAINSLLLGIRLSHELRGCVIASSVLSHVLAYRFGHTLSIDFHALFIYQ
jgi:hypothetical protein